MIGTWLGVVWWMASAFAVTQEDVTQVRACVDLQDIACAQAIIDDKDFAHASPEAQAVAADVAFRAGDYPRAYDLLAEAAEGGLSYDGMEQTLALYERTAFATAGWVERSVDGFRVRYRPGVDAILVNELARALALTDERVVSLIGDPSPGETLVEIFPDGRSFVAASSLTKDDVEATGVVALSKWSRLLLASPRALGRGFDWKSTVSHEYIHLVVAHNTHDNAPVWLQEAVAKFLDSRWATGTDSFKLSARDEGQLAQALQDNALVPFSEMHPSLAKIKVFNPDGTIDQQASAERSGLAYAQLAMLMRYAFERGGDDVLLRLLPLVRDEVDAMEAMAQVLNAPNFDAVIADWERWMRTQGFVDKHIKAMPTVFDGGSAEEADPVLSKRNDLANFVRLGDLLANRGRYRAALIEYDKGRDEEDPNSPLLATRMARAHAELGDRKTAMALLKQASVDYPTYSLSWRMMGDMQAEDGHTSSAIALYEKLLALSPFDVEVHKAVRDLYADVGDMNGVSREDDELTILRRGGEDVDREPIHERFGSFEVPRSKLATGGAQVRAGGSMEGKPAPDAEFDTLDGEHIVLSELRGKVVILDFWATWCGPCRSIMPRLSELQKQHASDGLVVLGSTNEPTATVKRFIATEAKRGKVFEQKLVLEGGGPRRDYGVSSIPHLVVVDREGIVAKVHVGAGDMDELIALVRDRLGVSGEGPVTE